MNRLHPSTEGDEMSATIEMRVTKHTKSTRSIADSSPSSYLIKKRLPVRLAGLLLAIVLTPVIGLLILIVRITSPGPGLYKQRRVGLNGREFTIYKLRSMRLDAEQLSGPIWATENDPRVTPIGGFLRWSHLDELPQIFNVVRGEMDFVGPRPERPEIIDELVGLVSDYCDRLEAMPGITGLAQVNLPPDKQLTCVKRKVAADKYYIANASLKLDLKLIGSTLLRIVGVRYHRGAAILKVGLPESVLRAGNLPEKDCSDKFGNDISIDCDGELKLTVYEPRIVDSHDDYRNQQTCPSDIPSAPR